jgi:hypothetical protein
MNQVSGRLATSTSCEAHRRDAHLLAQCTGSATVFGLGSPFHLAAHGGVRAIWVQSKSWRSGQSSGPPEGVAGDADERAIFRSWRNRGIIRALPWRRRGQIVGTISA